MISIHNIHKSFDGESVLAGASFAVHGGTLVAVVGPSGAGKTTLLNIISGILLADKGTVQVSRNSRLGYMLQEPALLPWRTLAENACLGSELVESVKGTTSQLIETLFCEFDLNGAQNKYPAQCSLGMQQRTAFIRTLAIEPCVLLLDEPFSSLDYDIKLRAQMNLARYVEQKKAAVLIVTHDIEDAIALADRVIIISAKPAVVKAEIQIDLGLSGRDPLAARTSPKFRDYFEAIWQHLKYLPTP
jgi:NitT/TauT family transport system ATP-binding protein